MFDNNYHQTQNGFGYYTQEMNLQNITKGYPKKGALLNGIFSTMHNNNEIIIIYGKISFQNDNKLNNILYYTNNTWNSLPNSINCDNIDSVTLLSDKIIITGQITSIDGSPAYNCLMCNLDRECSLLNGGDQVGLPGFVNIISTSSDGVGRVCFTYNNLQSGNSFASLICWDQLNFVWKKFFSVEGYASSGFYVLIWSGDQMAVFGANVIIPAEYSCQQHNIGFYFWWNEANNCFMPDSEASIKFGVIYGGVKGKLSLQSYYLCLFNIFKYVRNPLGQDNGTVSDVTGNLFDLVNKDNYPVSFYIQSDENGTIFLIDGKTGELFWMKENNVSIWYKKDIGICIGNPLNPNKNPLSYSNGKIYYTCPGLDINTESIEIYELAPNLENNLEKKGMELFPTINGTYYYATVTKMCSCGEKILAFGDFTSIGETPIKNLGWWNGKYWEKVFEDSFDTNKFFCLTFSGKIIFALGNSTHVCIYTRSCSSSTIWQSAVFEIYTGSFLGGITFDPITSVGYLSIISYFDNKIFSFDINLLFEPQLIYNDNSVTYITDLIVYNNHLFIGGEFSVNLGGNKYDSLMHYHILGSGLNNGSYIPLNGTVDSITSYVETLWIDQGTLYIGGYFNEILGMSASNLVAMNLTTFQYDPTINIRFAQFFQSSNEYVTSIRLTKSGAIYLRTQLTLPQISMKLYYQEIGSDFLVLHTNCYSISLFDYYRFFLTFDEIIVLSGIFLVIFTSILVMVCIILRKNRSKHNSYISLPNFDDNSIQNNFNIILEDKSVPKIDQNKIVLGDLLGSGGQAIVRNAKYKGKDVAAKSILQMRENELSEFLREIKLLCSLKNKNILKTYGICIYAKELLLITEKMSVDLEKMIGKIEPNAKFNICVEITNAIFYLHSFDPPILHRDLKPSNILLNRKGVCKLSDFGVSRVYASTMTQDTGTIIYMAPEMFFTSNYNESADIYSLGLLFVEVYIEKNPFHKINLSYMFEIVEKIKNKEMIPVYPIPEEHKCPHLMISVMKQMLSYEPKERPSASQVKTVLREKKMKTQLDEYFK